MNARRFTSALLAVLILAMALVGCSSGAQPTSQQPGDASQAGSTGSGTDENKHITFITPLIAHESWLIAKEGFDAAAADLGFEAEWVGPANQDVNEMIKYIEIAIAQNVTGIITQGQNPEAMVEVLQKAADAGIPVVICDSTIEDAPQLAYIGFDMKKAADLAVEQSIRELGEGTPINALFLTTAIDYSAANVGYVYFNEALEAQATGEYKMQQQETKGDPITARQLIEATLQADPTINTIYCIDGIAAPAAVAVLEDMGRLDDVCIIGIDDTDEQLDLIRAGKISAVTYGSFYKQAYQGCLWILEYRENGSRPEHMYNDVGTMLITADNVDTYKATANDPSTWGSYEPLSYIDEQS